MGMTVARGMTAGIVTSTLVIGLSLGAAGAAGAASGPSTTRVSVSSTGAQGFRSSEGPSLSADGRYVAFASKARNLVPGDTNLVEDIFVRDRLAGTTRRVSVGQGGAQSNGASSFPALSRDGLHVAFQSAASNLVSSDTNGTFDVFVRDLLANTTRRISVGPAGAQDNGASLYPAISGNGRFVAVISDATDLVTGDTNGFRDVFVRDRLAAVTQRASVGPGGVEANNISVNLPSISADGRFVGFDSSASNLVPGDTNGVQDIFVRDLQAAITTRVSRGAGGGQS